MACNSFTSVSLVPPLVSFCAAETSATWPKIARQGRFCVNVMASHHERVTRRFSKRGVDRFGEVEYSQRHGAPAIVDAAAWFDCAVEKVVPAGDHAIIVGSVHSFEARASNELRPLVFFRGRYGSFDPDHSR